MGYISNVVFCENAVHEDLPGGISRSTAVGLLARGDVLSVPSFFSMTMFVLINAGNLNDISKIKIRVSNPEDKDVFVQEFDMASFPKPIVTPPEAARDLHMSLNIQNLIIDSLGYYSFEFFFDSKKDYECKFLFSQKEMKK